MLPCVALDSAEAWQLRLRSGAGSPMNSPIALCSFIERFSPKQIGFSSPVEMLLKAWEKEHQMIKARPFDYPYDGNSIPARRR